MPISERQHRAPLSVVSSDSCPAKSKTYVRSAELGLKVPFMTRAILSRRYRRVVIKGPRALPTSEAAEEVAAIRYAILQGEFIEQPANNRGMPA